MAIPLSFLSHFSTPPAGASLGDALAESIAASGSVNTLLDCLCSTSDAAIYSPDPARPPLLHNQIHSFVANFALPHSSFYEPLGPNDRVMIVLPTGPENALALLAVASYHTCAPVNASCTSSELKDDAERLNVKAVVTTSDAEGRLELQSLHEELGCDIIYIHPLPSGPTGLFDMSLMGEVDSGIDERTRKPTRLHGLYDQSLVLHTSGTSGKKKVVPYTLRSLIVGTCAVMQSWDLRPSDVNMNMMPLFHVGGIVRNLFAPVLSGGSAIMCSGFDPIAFWSLAQEFGATWYYAAPTIHRAILSSRPNDPGFLEIRMICNAAGGLLPSLAVELKETFSGAIVLPSYGMTECMPIATPPTTYQLDRPGCSGIACGPYLSIRDTRDIEREVPRGQTGAVSVRGIPTFEGYQVSADPSAPLDTSAFSSEGWFDSGDVGYMDSDGYLFITGRSKEIINKGGEVISPFEVEEAIVIAAKGYVKTTIAFSIDHDVLQETIGVVIVPVHDQPRIGLTQLQDLLRDHLHPSKWPFALVYMEDVPKNSAGKPLRIKLSSRLGLGCLTDAVPVLHRHFEAQLPDNQASLSEPIPCRRVSLNPGAIETALLSTFGVTEAATRVRQDGSPEAVVSVDERSGVDSANIKEAISRLLPGYSVPDPLYVTSLPLVRNGQGEVDFDSMQSDIMRQNAASMSEHELLVRDIVANLLNAEPGNINSDSDFFLLGGNSLLLGKLAYHIRKEMGVSVGVPALFTNSSIRGIAGLVDNEQMHSSQHTLVDKSYSQKSPNGSDTTLNYNYDYDNNPAERSRGQNHPLSLIIQAMPIVFFYPFKTALTWTILLYCLSYLARVIDTTFWQRIGALLAAIAVARAAARIICPITAILFKWIVIGKYRPGTYRMWSSYHLRWWIVNQSLRSAGRGIFSIHPSLEILYYRLLGANIGKDVHIDKKVRLGEYDLITIHDGCRIDTALVRGFCVERDGSFRLDNIVIGRNAVVNTYTQISPGAVIPEGAVYGPHSSSHEQPLPQSFAACNRTLIAQPHWALKIFVALPITVLVIFVSYIPWFTTIWLMLDQTDILRERLNALESVIYWFAAPERVFWHGVSRVVRATITPLLQLILGIIVKRIFGLNSEGSTSEATQRSLLRRHLNSSLLSQQVLKRAFSLLGNHYEVVSVVFRAMGAKIGRRVYWPGSSFYCLDPELLEIGDDVVFGSRSELFTTDAIGTGRITIGSGAMIADRVVLLPGTRVGKRTVMGTGALSKRGGEYEDGSTWMGNERGEAICFSRAPKDKDSNGDTTTAFGRAFYKRQANYFVYPYFLIVAVNFFVASLSATYWSISAVTGAQLLRHLHIHLKRIDFFAPRWYRLSILYGLIASFFVIALNLQAILALLWVILTKWIVIGRRKAGPHHWDQSSYCQRWGLHLVLSRPIYKGYGNGGILAPITGSAYIVWFYRALGAKIGKNCAIYAGGNAGLMTEPDLVELGDNVSIDNASVVAHINSRGNFALNKLKIGNGCALRSGSRLLSGASMEDDSMLCEHTLLTSGEVADTGAVYVGWPAKQMEKPWGGSDLDSIGEPRTNSLTCPMCLSFPKVFTVTPCGHLFCESCITRALSEKGQCPVCTQAASSKRLTKIYPSFAAV